ncbi:MAG: GNAT family N-acetyltransferase [Caldilineaceae bacterium]
MTVLTQFTTQQAEAAFNQLIELLQNVVDDGASIGFIAPLSREEAHAYWTKIIGDLDGGNRLLFVATENDQILGSVQLALEPRKNGEHRAEVQKLMVHTQARNRGLGRRLMQAVEDAARAANRSLIVLDTRRGDVADQLYQKIGYIQAGIIPRYALSSSGTFDDTVFYYRFI